MFIVNAHKNIFMTGKALKERIEASGVPAKKIAELLKISPQDLNSKLRAQSVKADFLERVEAVINKTAYGAADTLAQSGTNEPEPSGDWKDKYIKQVEMTAEAERIARIEAQEAKLAEREAKEAYKKLLQVKDAMTNDLTNPLVLVARLDTLQVWLDENLDAVLKKGKGKIFADIGKAAHERSEIYKSRLGEEVHT